MTSTRHLAARFAVAIAFFFVLAPAALAQTSTIEPAYVVVTRPDSNPAQLRCFAGQIWYPIVFLDQGQVLRADAARDDWYRVGYPTGVPAAVTISEARHDSASNTVTLTDASSLQARNIGRPTSIESYKEIFDPKLPAGTVLPVVGEMLDGGQLSGYFVLPPDGASGWVNRRHVRDATQAEIDSYLRSLSESTEAVTDTKPAPPVSEPEIQNTTDDSPADTTPVELTPIDADPESNPAPATEEPEPASEAQLEAEPVDEPMTDSSTDGAESSDTDNAEMPEATPEEVRAQLYARLSELDSSYAAISDQQTQGAEIEPLRAEYIALRNDARAMAGDAALVRMAEYADARIDLLGLRAEVQEMQAQLAELAEQSDANLLAIQSTHEGIMRARGYAMLGVLTRSSLYTGNELPLRYRLQSGTSANARTIAYIETDPETDITPLLGKHVGIIVARDGTTRTGPVPILRAELVEAIELADAILDR